MLKNKTLLTQILILGFGLLFMALTHNQYDAQRVSAEKDNKPTFKINDADVGDKINQFQYNGEWSTSENIDGLYEGTEHWSNTIPEDDPQEVYYTVKFKGEGIKLFGTKDPKHGIYAVSVDGGEETEIDAHSDTRKNNQLLYESDQLEYGEHVIKVKATGKSTGGSPDMQIDYAEVSTKYIEVTGIEMEDETLEIKDWVSTQLTANVLPDDATNKNVLWSSSDKNVAKIDEKGMLTAEEAGNATITAETGDGNYTATREVNVSSGKHSFLPEEGLDAWVPTGDFSSSSLIKVPKFPRKISGDVDQRKLELNAVRNEQVSAQLAVASTEDIQNLYATVGNLKNDNGDQIGSDEVQIRYADYIHVEEKDARVGGHMSDQVVGRAVSGEGLGEVADPLLKAPQVDVSAYEAQPIWFKFNIPESAEPGDYQGQISVKTDNNETITYDLKVNVNDVAIPDPEDYQFDLDIWMNPNAIAEAYDVKPWSEEHWSMINKYFQNQAESGQSAITTPIVQHPWAVEWNGGEPQTATGYDTMIKWKYDGETWDFDYALFDRYVQTGIEAGVGPKINAYSMLAFAGKQKITYEDELTGDTVTKEVDVGDPFWTEAWTGFLKDFSAHLEKKDWLEQTYMAFDERPAHLMSQATDLIDEVAPEFSDQIGIAGTSDVSPYAQDLTLDFGSLQGVPDKWIQQRHDRGKVTKFYTSCCSGAHPNSFTYSPSVETQMIGWIAADRNLDGFLRWAYNSWPIDVFNNPVYAFPQGDEYFVYPGEDGPMSSIRWELLKEGIEDYELAQIVKQKNPDSKILDYASNLAAQQKDGREKDVQDITNARNMLVNLLDIKDPQFLNDTVDQLQNDEEIKDGQAVRTLQTHINSVAHFVKQNKPQKTIKHMKGFKKLIEHQKNEHEISESAYEVLNEYANAVIQTWE